MKNKRLRVKYLKLFTIVPFLPLFILETAFLKSINGQTIVDEVDVHGNYIPRLKPREKFFDRPVMQDTFRITLKPQYALEAPIQETHFEPDSIRPQKFKPEPLPKGKRLFVKLGFGNYLTPYAEVRAGSIKNRQHVYDVGYTFLAGAGKISDRGHPGVARHDVQARWRFRNEQKQLFRASVGYENQRVHYYGFRAADFPELSRKDYRQTYNHLGLRLGFENAPDSDSSRWRLAPGLQYGFTTDRFGSAENSLSGGIGLGKSWKNVRMEDRVEGGFFYNSSAGSAGFASGWAMLNPAVVMTASRLFLRLGAAGYMTAQPGGIRWHAVPDVLLKLHIADRYLLFEGEAGGQVYRSSLDRLRRDNPFLLTAPRLDFTRHQLAAGARLAGAFGQAFQWSAGGRFDLIERQAFFVNAWADTLHRIPEFAGFEVVYGRLTRTTVAAMVQYQYQEKYQASLSCEYYFFHQTNPGFPERIVPYHPQFRITARGQVRLLERILLRADIYYIHKQTGFARDTINTFSTYSLKGVADINVAAEYRFNEFLGFWAGFYNMGAFAYNRWYRYPTQGFNALGGVTLRF
ncbi:MAG: hypothetical protein N2050_05825 [Flavobacteriales bacterium]|nr:hypothetical protein [Flavobacteriales bacterium]